MPVPKALLDALTKLPDFDTVKQNAEVVRVRWTTLVSHVDPARRGVGTLVVEGGTYGGVISDGDTGSAKERKTVKTVKTEKKGEEANNDQDREGDTAGLGGAPCDGSSINSYVSRKAQSGITRALFSKRGKIFLAALCTQVASYRLATQAQAAFVRYLAARTKHWTKVWDNVGPSHDHDMLSRDESSYGVSPRTPSGSDQGVGRNKDIGTGITLH